MCSTLQSWRKATESAICFEFPAFEGRYVHLNEHPDEVVNRLPHHPSIDQVYVLHGTQGMGGVNLDGWNWARPNKSNKSNFVNIPQHQKAFKLKCSEIDCPAVKFVDEALQFKMSRVYYEYEHKHEQSKAPPKPKSKVRKISLDGSDDDDFVVPQSQIQFNSIPIREDQ